MPLGAVVAVACGAQFLVVIDSLVVTVALPDMQANLGLSAPGQQWVVTGYLVACGGLLLLAARLGDVVGHRRMFLIGLSVFTLASLVGGLAPNGPVLIAARVAQGAGAAALAPSSLSLITLSHADVDHRRRTRALAAWSAVSAAAGACGLVLGGLITDLLGWRWVLLLNLPVCGAVGAAAIVTLAVVRGTDDAGDADVAGAALVTGAAAALVFGLARAGESGWGHVDVLAPLAAAAVLVGALVIVECIVRQPLIPLSIFRRRGVMPANVLMTLLAAVMTATMVFLSIYMQGALGYSPLTTGLALMPMSVVIAAGAFTARALVPRVGARWLLVVGCATSTLGLLWLATLSAQSVYLTDVLGPSVLWAAGIGVMPLPLVALATSDVVPDLAGLASGLVNTARQVGGAIGLAVFGSLAGSSVTIGATGEFRWRTALVATACVTAAAALFAALTVRTPREHHDGTE
ncbi:MFS transporter [Gordonia sinesedis]